MQVTVEIPDDLVAALHLTERDPAGAVLEAMALEAFRERRLTSNQLRTLLGIPSRYELWEFLKERQIEICTVEDLEHDVEAMNNIVRP